MDLEQKEAGNKAGDKAVLHNCLVWQHIYLIVANCPGISKMVPDFLFFVPDGSWKTSLALEFLLFLYTATPHALLLPHSHVLHRIQLNKLVFQTFTITVTSFGIFLLKQSLCTAMPTLHASTFL